MTFDFDKIAEDFDETRSFDPRLLGSVAKGVLAIIGKESSLVDIGTGTGRYLLPITSLGISAYGIDISKKMLLKAKKKGMENLILGNALKLPFPDDRFDASLVTSVLHLVDDWRSVVREAGRVSRKAVISIDPGKDRNNPNEVFKSIVKEKNYNFAKKGPYERELCDRCSPKFRVKLPDYIEMKKKDEIVATFEKKTFTFQSELTDDENMACVEEMRSRFPGEMIPITWNPSLIVWDPKILSGKV